MTPPNFFDLFSPKTGLLARAQNWDPAEYDRLLATAYAWSYLGRWYKWGGDDPSGFDCSGFTREILRSQGRLPKRPDMTAHGQSIHFQEVALPKIGCLVCYGTEKRITHIDWVLDRWHSIGASSGSSKTKTVEDAIRDNAFIKIRRMDRRRDLVKYVDPFLTPIRG